MNGPREVRESAVATVHNAEKKPVTRLMMSIRENGDYESCEEEWFYALDKPKPFVVIVLQLLMLPCVQVVTVAFVRKSATNFFISFP